MHEALHSLKLAGDSQETVDFPGHRSNYFQHNFTGISMGMFAEEPQGHGDAMQEEGEERPELLRKGAACFHKAADTPRPLHKRAENVTEEVTGSTGHETKVDAELVDGSHEEEIGMELKPDEESHDAGFAVVEDDQDHGLPTTEPGASEEAAVVEYGEPEGSDSQANLGENDVPPAAEEVSTAPKAKAGPKRRATPKAKATAKAKAAPKAVAKGKAKAKATAKGKAKAVPKPKAAPGQWPNVKIEETLRKKLRSAPCLQA